MKESTQVTKKGILTKEEKTGLFFILPGLIFLMLVIGYPIVYNIILSLQEVNVMTIAEKRRIFVGISNYLELRDDPAMRICLLNTLTLTVRAICLQFIFGFSFALFFNMRFLFAKPLRGLLVISWLIPHTITAMLLKFMLSTQGGIINEILILLGTLDKPYGWLTEQTSAMWGIIVGNVWIGVPFNMILLATGLSTIAPEIHESVKIDGATVLQKFWYVTLPLMRPAILAVLVLGFIYTFKIFDLIFVATNGGPVYATEVLSTFAYKTAFEQFNYSKGAAIANVLFFILLLVGLLYIRLIKAGEEVQS